ncbi:DUF5819 family protein [Aeromicrobium sp. Root495]|uniref:DUF5819 family protein n=1 Tax=Aeromicrobium sp. Root495 TaxID=1736550 RepID=UPI000B2A70A6|nr:DUF5819 family protein [Aeromicrobium sp. Root495]
MPEENEVPEQAATRRRLSARGVVVALLVLVAGFHVVAVSAAALPPNRYSDAVRPVLGYLNPYFTQNWRLFAPNPVSSDRTIRFQAAIRQDDGVVTTSWVDWTDVELDLVHHRLIGNRAGYVTNKAYSSLGTRYGALATVQRKVADVGDPAAVPSWRTLAADLGQGNAAARSVARLYLVYDRAATRLATDVMMSRHPRSEIVAVRYALRSQGVAPYAARGGTKAEREAARPLADQRINGWRAPLPGGDAERKAVADFDRRHRSDR